MKPPTTKETTVALTWSIDGRRDEHVKSLYEKHVDGFSGKETGKYKLKAPYEAIVFMTMAVGIPKITEDNVDEFAKRLHMDELINGKTVYAPMEQDDGSTTIEDVHIQYSEVRDMIGLRTNAPRKSRTDFTMDLLDTVQKQASRWVERSKRMADDACGECGLSVGSHRASCSHAQA